MYCPVWVVRTGSPGYRDAEHSVPGGTIKIGRRRSIEGEKRKKKKRKRRKKKKRRRRKKYLLFLCRPPPHP
ncbi:hypothetical protein B296_00025426 [Ensete ventricosum]|uniref:Uncharacterized protein n=1 Tax=Ensete ventricosum TaxID=4639 RepID=A0A427A0Z3_ENSVE|nr:hypothetical protein B296_00025426 [Ensete ventricosum]